MTLAQIVQFTYVFVAIYTVRIEYVEATTLVTLSFSTVYSLKRILLKTNDMLPASHLHKTSE